MNHRGTIVLLLMLAAGVLALAPFLGMEPVPLRALWGDVEDYTKVDILWKLRIPRVILAFLAGTALATSGMTFQAMFRNPLATPFTLGVSSGAALGAALCIQWGWTFSILGIPSISLSAFVGAVASILLVYALTARTRGGSSTATMLLAGVAISFFFASMILFLQYLSDFTRTYRMLRWTMGGLENVVDFHDVLNLLPFVVSGCLIVWYFTHDLNMLTAGEEFSFARGVNVAGTKAMLFFAVSLMVGAVVAVCGPIGFVGLMVPHICRLLIGPDHRWLYPASWLFGGVFLVICDTAARIALFVIVGSPAELPVGILTSLLGGPFFLWLLLARKNDLGTI
jgi:iron complex transport system permease protein